MTYFWFPILCGALLLASAATNPTTRKIKPIDYEAVRAEELAMIEWARGKSPAEIEYSTDYQIKSPEFVPTMPENYTGPIQQFKMYPNPVNATLRPLQNI